MKTPKILAFLFCAITPCIGAPEPQAKADKPITVMGVTIGQPVKSFLENPEIKKAESMEEDCYLINKKFDEVAKELEDPKKEREFLESNWGGQITFKPKFKPNEVTLMGLPVEYARMTGKYDPSTKQFRVICIAAFLTIPADSNFEKSINAVGEALAAQLGSPKTSSTYAGFWRAVGKEKTNLAIGISDKKLFVEIGSEIVTNAITDAQTKRLKEFRDAVAAPKITTELK